MNIYFLRHGESVNNPMEHQLISGVDYDTPLSTLGRQQAKQLAATIALQSISSIDAVYVSPTLRTRQTLALLDTAPLIANSPHVIDERIIELSQGTAEGKPRQQVYIPTVIQQRDKLGKDFAFPGGESMNQAALRLGNWIADIRQTHDENATIFAISHAMLLRSYVSYLCNWTMQQTLENTLENCHAVELSISKNTGIELVRFNASLAKQDIPH